MYGHTHSISEIKMPKAFDENDFDNNYNLLIKSMDKRKTSQNWESS